MFSILINLVKHWKQNIILVLLWMHRFSKSIFDMHDFDLQRVTLVCLLVPL